MADPISKVNFAPGNSLDIARLHLNQGKEPSRSEAKSAKENGDLGSNEVSPARKKEIDGAATQFEALLLHQMFNAMWSTVPEGGVLSGSREEEFFRDMYTQGLADEMAKGDGIGIKKVLAQDMYRQESKTVGKPGKE